MSHNNRIDVWDPLVRTFHWLLVICFAAAYLLEDERLSLHLLAGSIVLGLVIFRVVWGVMGTTHARFAAFASSPGRMMQHLRDLIRLHPAHHTGHTPLGGMMIFVLLGGLLLLTMSGVLLYSLENSAVPFAGFSAELSPDAMIFLEQVHGWIADLLALLALVHVTGVVVESVLQKQNLIRAMVTGYKTVRKENE